MQKDSLRIANFSTDERALFLDAFNITIEEYLKNYTKSAECVCSSYSDYKKKYKKYQSYLEQKAKGLSVAAIIKKKEFYKHLFKVDAHVLIPRPETEELVEKVINLIKKQFKNATKTIEILDLCTGSGVIGISVYDELRDEFSIKLTMTDVSKHALGIARENVKTLIPKANVEIVESNLFDSFNAIKKWDVILSNPPYVPEKYKNSLLMEVLHEPHIALFGGRDGIRIIKKIIKKAKEHLNETGFLLMEIDISQKDAIIELAKENGYEVCHILNDLTERPRFALLKKMIINDNKHAI